jgi:hypothetical protein
MNERRNAYIKALKAADSFDFAPLLAFVGLSRTHEVPVNLAPVTV